MPKPILQEGESVLRDVAKEVPQELFGTQELKTIIEDMKQALEPLPSGVALAAPQIGISYRIFIIRHDRMLPETEEELEPDVGIFINPKIIKTSRKKVEIPEGCLSTTGVFGTTTRFERATVQAQDVEGKTFTRGAGGILAQAFQHEIEHLDGTLFIDHAKDLYHYDS